MEVSNTTIIYVYRARPLTAVYLIAGYSTLEHYWYLTQPAIRPTCYFLLAILTAPLILCVDPTRRRRLAPLFLLPAWQCLSSISQIQWPSDFGSFLGLVTTVGCLEAVSVLYIEEAVLQPQERVKAGSGNIKLEYIFTSMWKTGFDLRRLRASATTSQIASQGQICRRRKHVANNRPFTWRRVARFLVLVLFNHFVVSGSLLSQLRPFDISDLERSKHAYFRRLLFSQSYTSLTRITTRETYIRLFLVLTSYIKPYLLMEGFHICAAIIFIYILHVDDPTEWPDLFGNPLEAYTLARFWSRFWHRLHVAAYTSWANWLTSHLSWNRGIQQHTRIALTNLIIFNITGLVHALVSWQMDDRCACRTEMQFYLISWVALVAERIWLDHWRAFKVARRQEIARDESAVRKQAWMVEDALARIVGYVWVMLFHFWIGPKMYFERMWCTLGE